VRPRQPRWHAAVLQAVYEGEDASAREAMVSWRRLGTALASSSVVALEGEGYCQGDESVARGGMTSGNVVDVWEELGWFSCP